jgi:hypothetical protein
MIWTSDRLESKGWDHNPSCPLCGSTMETSHHLCTWCRYTRRVWTLIADQTGQPYLNPNKWTHSESVLQWWTNLTSAQDIPHKATRSIVLLVNWEIWKERNDRVFNHHKSLVPSIVAKIKSEASDWIAAGIITRLTVNFQFCFAGSRLFSPRHILYPFVKRNGIPCSFSLGNQYVNMCRVTFMKLSYCSFAVICPEKHDSWFLV